MKKTKKKKPVKKWANDAEGRRDYSLRKRFGINTQTYNEMLEDQSGVCAICHEEDQLGRRLAVDHNHESLTVRGLLCSFCNMGLGYFRDDCDLLENAINYIQRRP